MPCHTAMDTTLLKYFSKNLNLACSPPLMKSIAKKKIAPLRKKRVSSKRAPVKKFIEDMAEHSGSGSDGGSGDSSECAANSADEAMINDVSSEGEPEEKVKLSRRERRLTKDDLLLVREAMKKDRLSCGNTGRRRGALLDDSEEDVDSDDFIDDDEEFSEDAEKVRRDVQDAMRESGLVRRHRSADDDDESSLKSCPRMPFGLRDDSGVLRNGSTGEIVRMPELPRLAPVGQCGAKAETKKGVQAVHTAASKPNFGGTLQLRQENSFLFKIVPINNSTVTENRCASDKDRHLPASLLSRLQASHRAPAKVAPVFAKAAAAVQEKAGGGAASTGVYRCGDSGNLYYRYADGRVSPRK